MTQQNGKRHEKQGETPSNTAKYAPGVGNFLLWMSDKNIFHSFEENLAASERNICALSKHNSHYFDMFDF